MLRRLCRVWRCSSTYSTVPILSLRSTDVCSTVYLTAHTTQYKSYASALKSEGYFSLSNERQINLPESAYAVHMVRGSGPGGQGADNSSNKVELRVSMSALSSIFDEHVIAALRKNEQGRALTTDGSTIVLASHDFRSAHQNRENCLSKVRQMIHHASWVPPEEGEPTKMPSRLITHHKMERRKKGNLNRARQAARKGLW